MSTNRKNKYNRTKTREGNTPPLGYFPIKQFRFRTQKHPVITSNDRCSSSVKALWSQQELLMITGLANSLKCCDREAIRIAIYEGEKADKKDLDFHASKARSGSIEKGHEGRSISKRHQMTRFDKECLSNQARVHGLKDSEMLRLCVIYLARGIREGSITRLTNSPQISQVELFREWSSGKSITESKLKALRLAANEAWSRADDDALELSEMIHRQKKLRRLYRSENPGLNNEALDAMIEGEQVQAFEKIVQKIVEDQKLGDEEEHVFRLMLLLDLDEDEARQIYSEELEVTIEEPSDDELLEIILASCAELEENRINNKLSERYGRTESPVSDAEYLARREWAISELEIEERERTNELNRSITKRLEHKVRRSTPEYRDDSRIRFIFEKNIQTP